MQQVADWLEKLGLGQYAQRFAENDINFGILPHLTDQDLKELGVASLGHRRQLLLTIAELKGAPERSTTVAVPVAPRDTAERRQVTVMFSDLVGSTALSARMDPEDLHAIISAYQQCVAETVKRFEGFVAKYMGDGVLVYFGYPQAHEDDAERAVRAGLELIAAVSELNTTSPLQTRVGIATGLVVVGDLIGSGDAQERGIVGETPNLAARLQALAEPNMVVIAEDTRKLLGNLFELQDLGARDLKGVSGPVRAWAALRPSSVESRFEALHTTGLTALVGREEELELLRRRWSRAKTGEGQVVLFSGEAGIGKSRLTAALLERLASEPHTRLRYFCSPQHTDSALYPIISQMERAAGLAHDDTPQAKLDKLDAVLALTSTPMEDAALFAEMLSLPNDGRYPVLALAPQQRRQRTLEALTTQLAELARQQPVLMIFEDIHWIDPTSLEALNRTVDRIETLRAQLIVTFRPEFNAPWMGQSHVASLTLNRLGEREAATIIARLVGNKELPADVMAEIVERTDGIPLFVEEMTKAVLEAESEGEGRRTVAAVPSPALAMVPASLRASLMARLDRLGPAKEVAQVGAAIGREFSYEVLAPVAGLPDAVLQGALIRLKEAELVFPRGTPPNAIYFFKHALVQDTAYSTMLRGRRQQLHSAIASVLEKRFPELVNSTPEVIAQQFERAGQNEKSIQYWRQAGDRGLRRFAMKESIAHYSNALRLVAAMPEAPERSSLELGVCLGLGLAQQIGIGPNAKESGVTYARALTLSRTLPGRGRERFLASWGVWFHTIMSGRLTEAFQRADDLLAIARELDDSDLLLEAYHARVASLFLTADFPAIKEASQEVIRLYNRERHRDHAYYFGGHDSRVCAQSFYAISLWGLGFPDQAQQMAWQGIEDARALGHAFSLAHGLNIGSLTLLLLNDVNACRAVADELFLIADRNKFSWPLAQARLLRGWLTSQQGDRDAGIEQMLKVIDEPSSAVLIFRPMFLTLIAEQQTLAAHLDAAIRTLARAMDEIHAQRARFYEPEIIRLRGEILLLQSRSNAAEAEAVFRQAMGIAAQQSCRAIELRACVSLARLLGDDGRRTQARDLLAPLYGAFTEGFDTLDLKEAKALLDELQA
jgi:class 3 adenylate cyclase/predicted ATPase